MYKTLYRSNWLKVMYKVSFGNKLMIKTYRKKWVNEFWIFGSWQWVLDCKGACFIHSTSDIGILTDRLNALINVPSAGYHYTLLVNLIDTIKKGEYVDDECKDV